MHCRSSILDGLCGCCIDFVYVFECVVNLLHVLYSSYKNVCSIAVDRVLSANLGDAREVMLC